MATVRATNEGQGRERDNRGGREGMMAGARDTTRLESLGMFFFLSIFAGSLLLLFVRICKFIMMIG
jgi:hypothetical protein